MGRVFHSAAKRKEKNNKESVEGELKLPRFFLRENRKKRGHGMGFVV